MAVAVRWGRRLAGSGQLATGRGVGGGSDEKFFWAGGMGGIYTISVHINGVIFDSSLTTASNLTLP